MEKREMTKLIKERKATLIAAGKSDSEEMKEIEKLEIRDEIEEKIMELNALAKKVTEMGGEVIMSLDATYKRNYSNDLSVAVRY
jgi:hypothetical protein